jgi:hypothetical protein
MFDLVELTLDRSAQFNLVDVPQDEDRFDDLAKGFQRPIQRVLLRIGIESPEDLRGGSFFRVSSGNGALRTLRVCLHNFKPSSGSLSWLPEWSETTFRNPSIRVPNVIAGQIDVLPPQR